MALLKVGLCVLMGAALSCAVQAKTLKFCIADRPAIPWSYPDHEGLAQKLLRLAVEQKGDTVEFTAMPWRRCLVSAQDGIVDGPLLASPNQRNNQFLSFPMKDGVVNNALAVGTDTYVVVARKGGGVTWDGHAFGGLSRPMIFPSGLRTVEDRFEQLGVSARGEGNTFEQIAEMLVAERAQAAVLRDVTARLLLNEVRYSAVLEILPFPFTLDYNHAPFTKKFTLDNPGYAEAVWQTIGKIRSSDAWHKQVLQAFK